MARSIAHSRYALAVTLVTLIGLAGCGSSSGPSSNGESSKTGPQVVKDAAAALGASSAAHIAGTVSDSGKAEKVDLQLQTDGTSGTLDISGVPVSIVAVGGALYIKAPASFYTAQKATPAAAAKVANRWVKGPASTDISSLSLAGLAKSLPEPDAGTTIENKVTTGTLHGQKVVIVRESDGSLLYVAATGKPYPLRAVNSASSKAGPGDATFSAFGQHMTLKAPAGAIDSTVGTA